MITSEKWCLTVSSNFTHMQAVGCLGWHPRHPSACTCVKIHRGLLFSFKKSSLHNTDTAESHGKKRLDYMNFDCWYIFPCPH